MKSLSLEGRRDRLDRRRVCQQRRDHGSLLIILGADILLAGLLAKNLEQASHAEHYLQNGTFELLHLV
jgi:hypothetical protein